MGKTYAAQTQSQVVDTATLHCSNTFVIIIQNMPFLTCMNVKRITLAEQEKVFRAIFTVMCCKTHFFYQLEFLDEIMHHQTIIIYH